MTLFEKILKKNILQLLSEIPNNLPTTSTNHSVGLVRGFLGIGNYYDTFIQNVSNVLQPLNQLLEKELKWDRSHELKYRNKSSPLMNLTCQSRTSAKHANCRDCLWQQGKLQHNLM